MVFKLLSLHPSSPLPSRAPPSSSVGLGPCRRASGVGVVRVAEAGVDGRGRGQHVSRVAEGGQVAHVRHVAQAAGAAKRRALVLHALGELVEAVARPLAALALAGHLAVARLDALLLHGQRPVHVVQFKVEAAGVAHRVTVPITPPQCSSRCLAVSAAGASSSCCGQSALGLDEGPVLAVHLVVEAAGVAQVVARPVPPPQGRGRGSAVHTLAALCAEF